MQFLFEGFGFGDEDFFFDVGMDAEILFEGLQLGQQDAIEGRIGLGRVVEADGLADVFQFVFGIVMVPEEAVDGVVPAGDDEGGEMGGRLLGFL